MNTNGHGKYIDFEHSVEIKTHICHFCRKPIKKFPFYIVKERVKENPYKIVDVYAHIDCFNLAMCIKENEDGNKNE